MDNRTHRYSIRGEFIDDSPVASDYVEYPSKRLEYAKAIADAFKQAMEE